MKGNKTLKDSIINPKKFKDELVTTVFVFHLRRFELSIFQRSLQIAMNDLPRN